MRSCAHAPGKGVLILTGHFGNFEVATTAGLASIRRRTAGSTGAGRSVLPGSIAAHRRFRRAGFGVLPKRGGRGDPRPACAGIWSCSRSTSTQPQGRRNGNLRPSGRNLRSLAVIALSTGAPVVPAASWREADGRHVLRFENESRLSTTLIQTGDPPEHPGYNRALER
jgi:KDO2-lipid IV(A) lauroyltransferase